MAAVVIEEKNAIDGQAYWLGKQLDEVATPILLAWRLKQANALGLFDAWPLVLRAARYLILGSGVTLAFAPGDLLGRLGRNRSCAENSCADGCKDGSCSHDDSPLSA